MGFLDVIRGMQNGPGGGASGKTASGGPSTMTMALLALLAYKAWKSNSANTAPPTAPADPNAEQGGLGGLLGGLLGGSPGNTAGGAGGLGGLLGGVLGGGALGGVLGDGLKKLVNDMQANGMGNKAQSWIDTGPNEQIDQNDLAKVIGSDDLDRLSQQTGMSREQFLTAIQTELPDAVNELTPEGHLPSRDELSRMV